MNMIADDFARNKTKAPSPDRAPILVLSPMSRMMIGTVNGEYYPPDIADTVLSIVGALDQHWISGDDAIAEFDAMKIKLHALGLDLGVWVQNHIRSNGIGCAICYAVAVTNYDEAKAIPGFAPLMMWSGYHAMLPHMSATP